MVDKQELSSAGLKFMDFAIRFFNMAKCQYQQQNQVKANKAGFQVLFILSMPEYTQPTMSFLADEMGITKQQLTKLVNDLEAIGLVKRIHDERNRRQVYVTLTERIFIRRAGAAGGLSGEIDSVIGEIQGELLNRQKHGKKE